MLGKLATSTCTVEAETADMALKRLMAVGVTRGSFAQDDLDSIATWYEAELCNTLQQTATHCNTLQHIATRMTHDSFLREDLSSIAA